MAQIQAYLGFGGNCAEAMHFYQHCLGGELNIMTVGDSPTNDRMPWMQPDHVMHASLSTPGFTLNASDMAENAQRGGLVSLLLECGPPDDIAGLFERLAEGGTVTQPLMPAFWGGLFGHLTDRYGVKWMFNQAQP